MEEFLGILFAGGRGTRLGLITQYISKAFVPVYDRPVFMYPLAQLEASRHIREIVILTNDENDAKLRQTGHRTIIQDDDRVHDMLSGLRYLREVLPTNRHCVLMPCDNVSDIVVDRVIDTFLKNDCEVCFSLTQVVEPAKLSQMGVYDPVSDQLAYKPQTPLSTWGVIAPYVIHCSLQWHPGLSDVEVFNQASRGHQDHHGYWFDVGDPLSAIHCAINCYQIMQQMSG